MALFDVSIYCFNRYWEPPVEESSIGHSTEWTHPTRIQTLHGYKSLVHGFYTEVFHGLLMVRSEIDI